ncbi:DUF485 domain-containing protein [Streptomyces boninensis]|uniref:DUF485 domain-containing protein n=1 Tax=Streptomyces boninensis TaxID=2039455 RepID=UPI003B219264
MDKHEAAEAHTPAAALDDPWHDELASGWGAWDDPEPDRWVPPPRAAAVPGPRPPADDSELYLEVQHSPEFQHVRDQYRRFVVPAVIAFLGWYLAYVIAATAAPGLMAHKVAGVVNVAILAGLGQFVTTFLLTWAYARHARLRRDQPALELRWDVTLQAQADARAHEARAHEARTKEEDPLQ